MKKKTTSGFYPGYSFGIKKTFVKTYASKEEIKCSIELMDKIADIKYNISCEPRPRLYEPLRDFQAELRGIRKLWRTRHSDSFESGVYTLTSDLSNYQMPVPVGKCGTRIQWYNQSVLKRGTLLVWVDKDELGANEFMVSNTNFLIKVPRGHSIGDKIQKVKEEQ